LLTANVAYDVYRGTADRTLRLATMAGAGLPAHVKRKNWVPSFSTSVILRPASANANGTALKAPSDRRRLSAPD
jgi:hypothetical protein